uniref:ABC transporter domain-containing protein n=1 Tax=Glossina brevipalpis TaxID=37001 RepID=A0A1A9X396_9MUSC
MWTPATIRSAGSAIASESVNYNSEWNKFLLLAWKNFHIMLSFGSYLLISIISPTTFCVMLIVLRITQGELVVKPAQNYNPVNLAEHWENLINILEERKAILNKKAHGFSYNSFVPKMVIGYAPNTLAFKNIMHLAESRFHPMRVQNFESCSELQKDLVAKSLFCGICFEAKFPSIRKESKFVNDLYPYHFETNLLFPAYLRYYNDTYIGSRWYTHSLYSVEHPYAPRSPDLDDGGYVGYTREGFSHIQNTIASSYLKAIIEEINSPITIPNITLNRFPQGKYVHDAVLQNVGYGISFMLVICNIYPILTLAMIIVGEKENKIKAFTRALGVGNYLHFISWVINASARSLISTIATVILLKVKWYSGVAIFNNTNFLSLLVVICIYNIAGICFCLMVSSFFKYSNVAVANIVYIWFLTYVPFLMSITTYQEGKSIIRLILLCIFHNTTFGYMFRKIVTYEQFGNNFNFIDFFTYYDAATNLSIGTYVLIMMGQCLVYMIISLYVEEVFPGIYGLPQHWNFLFTRKKSYAEKSSKDPIGFAEIGVIRPESFIYEIASSSTVMVDVNKVTKKYGDEEVVKNVSLQLRQNEITVLVGHNASGKTTLVSMICGLIPPTKGSVSIEGFNVIKDRRFACASVGMCMQDTVLYGELSISDQLRFFGYLRGLDTLSVEDDVEKYLHAADLSNKREVLTKNLAAGPRQELAICCALIGRSRVVILDEPNALLDEVARMRNWELITKERFGRTILITESNPDVLEALGDRVAIISHGELQCVGSPAFVKQMYGKGYRLICTKGPECDAESVTDFVRQHISSIIMASEIGNKIMYILDEKYYELFSELFKELESNSKKLHLTNFTLRRMNLYDIYLKMGSLNPAHENRTRLIDILNDQYEGTKVITETRPNLNENSRRIAENYGEAIFWLGVRHSVESTKGESIEEYFFKKDYSFHGNQDIHVGVTFFQDRIVCWFHNYGVHTVPLALNLVHNAIQRHILGEDSSMQLSLTPISGNAVYIDGQERIGISTGTLLAIFVTMSSAFLLSSRNYFQIKNRKSGFYDIKTFAGAHTGITALVEITSEIWFLLFMACSIIVTIIIYQKQIFYPANVYVWYFVIIVTSAFCIYSFNSLMAEFIQDPLHGYLAAVTLAFFGIVFYCHYAQGAGIGYNSTTKPKGSIYFLILPHFAMCNAISTLYYNSEFKRVCDHSEIQIVSKVLEECKVPPNCCHDYSLLNAENGVLHEMIAFLLITSLSWLIILLRQTKHHWDFYIYRRDDYFAQLYEHKVRHYNDESRFSQREVVMELYKIQHMRRSELPKYGVIVNRTGRYFGDKVGCDRVSFAIPRGEAFGIIGVSGCGKTTLFDLISGRVRVSYGRSYIAGVSMLRDYDKYKGLIGYALQASLALQEITVRDILRYICRLRGYPMKSVEEICTNLAKVLGIYDHYAKSLAIISEGTSRMLICTIALMGNPPLIILDMVSDSIDSSGRLKLWRILEKVRIDGTSILCASNSFDEIERFCKRTSLMSYGRICVIAPPMELDKLYSEYYLLRVKFYSKIYRARYDLYERYIYIGCFNKLCKFIIHEFPDAMFQHEVGNYLEFLMPLKTSSMWNTFSIMQSNAYFLNIEDFELTHTFYQSFLEFTQRQHRMVQFIKRS